MKEQTMVQQQRILIVDDHEDHRFILRYRLQRLGSFAIVEASDGAQALVIAAHEPVDLIFMNLRLPVVDGWETTRRIRALASPGCDVPIVAHTAYVSPQARTQALAAGCDAYIEKPLLDRAAFEATTLRLLSQGRALPL
jgi:CheY-like chemotaxis protein